jgi:hypothetical protein
MDVASRMSELSTGRRLGLVLAVTFLSACSSKGTVDASMASGGAGGAQAGQGGAQAGQGGAQAGQGGAQAGHGGAQAGGAAGRPVDAGASDGGDAGALTLSGPCVEGMECNGNDPGGSPQFHCVCTAGKWVCPTHDSHGWLTSDLPLPSTDPQNATSCSGMNYACTLPDRCGGLCVCNQIGKWTCKTLLGDVDGGAVTSVGTADAGSANSVGGSCAWPPCSVYGATVPPTAQCFTPICFSTVHPSGDTFFGPGVGGCSMEH